MLQRSVSAEEIAQWLKCLLWKYDCLSSEFYRGIESQAWQYVPVTLVLRRRLQRWEDAGGLITSKSSQNSEPRVQLETLSPKI